MECINYATYLERLKDVRRELRLLECMCLQGKIAEPILEGDADSALAQYAMIALQTVAALEECGHKDWSEIQRISGEQRWASKLAGQVSQ